MERSRMTTLAAHESRLLASRSSLDLLDGNCDGQHVEDISERGHNLAVEGAPASTINRAVSKASPRKLVERKVSVRRGAGTRSRTSASNNNNNNNNNNETKEENEEERHLQWLTERTPLLEEIAHLKLELAHAREEKLELEESFRRLDREIADGYNLSARKDKEIRIAELQTKNQKLAEMLEKELKKQNELRFANGELVRERDNLQHQTELVNGLLRSTEAKLSDVSTAHTALAASYSAAQERMESLQDQVNELQHKLVSSTACEIQFSEYEDKLRRWERKSRGLEKNLSESADRVLDLQQSVERANYEAQQTIEDRNRLEMELRAAHDKLIQMTASLRAAEAKLEIDLRQSDGNSGIDVLHKRIQLLEADLNERTRAYLEVKQAFNQLLSSTYGPQGLRTVRRPKSSGSARDRAPMEATKVSSHAAVLQEKLRRVEEARDRKGYVVSVLMQALPFLMQLLDDISDKYQAASESNEILKSAIEQMQASWVGGDDTQQQRDRNEALSPLAFLQLARENYVLGAPLTTKLIAECSGTPTFFDFASDHGQRAAHRGLSNPNNSPFAPFRVTTVASRLTRSSSNQNEEAEADAKRILVLAADQSDCNGDTYLNRSKINLFLQFIQGQTAKKKIKSLLVGKLAECLTKMRELAWRSSVETASHQATIQLLTREVDELKQRIQQQQLLRDGSLDSERDDTASIARRQLLLKVVDLYAEKQQQQRQSTFLTQTETSDILINDAFASQQSIPFDTDILCLQNLQLRDGDIEQLLWKILVSEARFVELQLDNSALSDTCASSVANFIAKLPDTIRTLSLRGNVGISEIGVEEIRSGAVRNPRVHRVEMDPTSNSLLALAASDDVAFSGKPTVLFRVLLPDRAHTTADAVREQDVDGLIDRLRQRGFQPERVQSPQKQSHDSSMRRSASRTTRRDTRVTENIRPATAASVRPGTERRAQAIKTRQQMKLQVLEDALRNASSPSRTHQSTTRSSTASFSSNRALSSMLYAQPLSRRITFTDGGMRLAGSSVGRAHVSIVRRLRR